MPAALQQPVPWVRAVPHQNRLLSPLSPVNHEKDSPSVFLPPSPSPYLFKELWRLIASLPFSRLLSTLNREHFDRWGESFAWLQRLSRTHRRNTRL